MRKRIFTPALLLSALVVLSACSSTGPRRGAGAEGRARGEGPAPGQQGRAQIQRLPSTQTLDEAERLSRHLKHYRPDVVLLILRKLQPITSSQLRYTIASGRYGPEFNGWLDLALKVRASLFDGKSVGAAAQRWAQNHPGHIIDRTAFADITTIYSSLFNAPAEVAVLLPESGGLAAAATAIRDGILNAYFDNPGHSMLRFYDSGGTADAATAAYGRAQAEGANQVIGPLRVESTQELGSRPDAGVPLLLLNDFSAGKADQGLPGINSLTLSQSEEAEAVADKALGQAQRRAIVMVPGDGWGSRIQSAFTEEFTAGDGRIVGNARFDSSSTDQAAMITQLLGIDASVARKGALQSQLGIRLGFEPYRRHDFDFIFLAANPQNGRQIKPLLRFYNAGDVPVYAMGRIYSGRVAPAADRDLDGIVFPITRWQLKAARKPGSEGTNIPESAQEGGFENLYALGLDAWQVLPWLGLLREDPGLSYPGQTGTLQMLGNGHLHREPAWARFSAGRPMPYHWPQPR